MPYNYIKRMYGTEFKAGMRVTFDEYDDAPGAVKQVRGDPHYVRVEFDDGREGNCHPSSLKILATATDPNRGGARNMSGPSIEMQNQKKDTWLVKNSNGKIVGKNLSLPRAEALMNEIYMKGE